MSPPFDFECHQHGTVASISALTAAADRWLREHVDAPAHALQIHAHTYEGIPLRRLGGEPRYMFDIALAMLRDGLKCEDGHRVAG